MLDLATKGGRKDEMEKMARIVYGTKQNHRISRKRDRCFLNNQQKTKFESVIRRQSDDLTAH